MSNRDYRDNSPVGLYLDLLKRTLTNTIYAVEPGEESEMTFWRDFMQHYIKGPAVSMLPLARFDNLQTCIADVVADNIAGDFYRNGGLARGGDNIYAGHA